MEPEDITSKFALLKTTIATRDAAIEITRNQINELQNSIRSQVMELENQMAIIAEPFEQDIWRLQTEIIEDVKLSGKSFKCEFGKASFRKEYPRTSWDSKKLDGLALVLPQINECKTVTIVQASVSISVGEQ